MVFGMIVDVACDPIFLFLSVNCPLSTCGGFVFVLIVIGERVTNYIKTKPFTGVDIYF